MTLATRSPTASRQAAPGSGTTLVLDYSKSPTPPLREKDAAWAREIVSGSRPTRRAP